LLLGELRVGLHKNNSHTCRRKAGGVYDSGLLTWVHLRPLLFSLVVDETVRGLYKNGCYTLRYTDDIAILIRGKNQNTIPELLQEALGMTQQ
jgi:Reverse transcriptase (RNA-dependent DNA polymerase).